VANKVLINSQFSLWKY